jgi:hypothetical protein
MRSRGIDFGFAEVRQHVIEIARRSGFLETIGGGHVFHTVDEAVSVLSPEGATSVKS